MRGRRSVLPILPLDGTRPTLREIDRILKPGGVFAAIDYDWPPVAGWRAEREYEKIYGKIREWEERLPDVNASFIRYRKDRHLTHIRDSGYFRYARELVFAHTEKLYGPAVYRHDLQPGQHPGRAETASGGIEEDLERFQKAVREIWGTPSSRWIFVTGCAWRPNSVPVKESLPACSWTGTRRRDGEGVFSFSARL